MGATVMIHPIRITGESRYWWVLSHYNLSSFDIDKDLKPFSRPRTLPENTYSTVDEAKNGFESVIPRFYALMSDYHHPYHQHMGATPILSHHHAFNMEEGWGHPPSKIREYEGIHPPNTGERILVGSV